MKMYSSSGVFCFSRISSVAMSVVEVSVEFLDCPRYLFEHPVEEGPPDDGGGLEDLLHLLVEPVDAGHDHPLDRIGDDDGLDLRGCLPATVLGTDRPLFNEGPHDLFEEERVAVGLLQG